MQFQILNKLRQLLQELITVITKQYKNSMRDLIRDMISRCS